LLAFFSGFEAACQPKSRRWSLSAMTLWPLGVAIYITGAIGESFGANIQRFSVTRELAKPEAERIPKKKQKLWVLGIVCYVLCGIFKAVSYNFAAQTMLAPLTLFLFASNIVFARLINKESFAFMTDGVATLLVVCGVVMCIIAAPSGKDEYTSEEMEELMSAWSFIVWVVVDVSLIVSLWTAQKLLWRKAGGDLTRLSPPVAALPRLHVLRRPRRPLLGHERHADQGHLLAHPRRGGRGRRGGCLHRPAALRRLDLPRDGLRPRECLRRQRHRPDLTNRRHLPAERHRHLGADPRRPSLLPGLQALPAVAVGSLRLWQRHRLCARSTHPTLTHLCRRP